MVVVVVVVVIICTHFCQLEKCQAYFFYVGFALTAPLIQTFKNDKQNKKNYLNTPHAFDKLIADTAFPRRKFYNCIE